MQNCGFIVLVVGVVCCSRVFATDAYLTPGGSDVGACDSGARCGSLFYAGSDGQRVSLEDGDIIYLAPGTYSSAVAFTATPSSGRSMGIVGESVVDGDVVLDFGGADSPLSLDGFLLNVTNVVFRNANCTTGAPFEMNDVSTVLSGVRFEDFSNGESMVSLTSTGDVSHDWSDVVMSGYSSATAGARGGLKAVANGGTATWSLTELFIDSQTLSVDGTGGIMFETGSGAATHVDGYIVGVSDVDGDFASVPVDENDGSALLFLSKGTGVTNVTLDAVGVERTDGGNRGSFAVIGAGSTVSVTNVGLSESSSASEGGAVYVGSGAELAVDGGAIISNSADVGGGAAVDGTLSLSSVRFFNNTARVGAGGGLYVANGGSLTTDDLEVNGNLATTDGGGVYSEGSLVCSGPLEMDDNKAVSGTGGGIAVADGSFDFTSIVLSIEDSVCGTTGCSLSFGVGLTGTVPATMNIRSGTSTSLPDDASVNIQCASGLSGCLDCGACNGPSGRCGVTGDSELSANSCVCSSGVVGASCGSCVAGSGLNGDSSGCEACEPGFYGPGLALEACLPCAENTESDVGATVCTECEEGFVSEPGSAVCTAAPSDPVVVTQLITLGALGGVMLGLTLLLVKKANATDHLPPSQFKTPPKEELKSLTEGAATAPSPPAEEPASAAAPAVEEE